MQPNIFVFLPCFGNVLTTAAFEATHRLMGALMGQQIGGSIATYSFPDIAELRNVVLSAWYDVMPQSTHILMLDADIGAPPQMFLDMLKFDQPVMGGLYPKRSLDLEWAASALPGQDQAERRDGFMEVEGLGAGALMIKREAIAQMIEKFPELIRDGVVLGDLKAAGAYRTLCFFDQIHTPKGKVAEDISFCRRWREAGGKVWANIRYPIEHVGQHRFIACFEQNEKRAAEAKQQIAAE